MPTSQIGKVEKLPSAWKSSLVQFFIHIWKDQDQDQFFLGGNTQN